MRHRDLLGADVFVSSVATVALGWQLEIVFHLDFMVGLRRDFAVGFLGRVWTLWRGIGHGVRLRRRGSLRIRRAADYGQGLLGLDAEKHLSQTRETRILVLEQLRQMNVGLDQRPDGFAVLGFEFVGIDAP